MKILEKILFVFIMVMLFFPLFQEISGSFEFKKPGGAYYEKENPSISSQKWFSGEFQNEYDKYIESDFGFHHFLIRLNNQLDYNLFKKINVNNVVIGKNGHLFDDRYIEEYTGEAFIGKEYIDKKLFKIKKIQDTLQNLNKNLLMVLCPSKVRAYPEYLSKKHQSIKKSISNYEYYQEQIIENEINCVDLNRFFLDIKDTVSYLLFPEKSVHWSSYGVYLTLDTCINAIENMMGFDLINMFITDYEYSYDLRHTKNDIGNAMNLLFEKKHPVGVYPVIRYEKNELKKRPSLLTIGDSFYFNFRHTGFHKEIFQNNLFLYYFKTAHFENKVERIDKNTYDIKKVVLDRDLLLIFNTELTINKLGWGFIENLYDDFFPDDTEDTIFKKKREIVENRKWNKMIKRKAKFRKISIEEMIEMDIKWLYKDDLKKQKVFAE